MAFTVETISLDSFYISLLLGLPKVLDKRRSLQLKKKYLSKNPPVQHTDLCVWEQKHGILLPEDLRYFFNSTDGFCFKWTCVYGIHRSHVSGKIEVNALSKICPLLGLKSNSDPGVILEGKRYKLRLGPNSKLFVLCTLDSGHMITLVYLNTRFLPTIWLLTTHDLEFYYLADNFTTYLRMAIAHLGFPHWHLLYTPQGVPEWTRVLMRLVIPKLLLLNKKAKCVEMIKKERSRHQQEHQKLSNLQISKLDVNIFSPNRLQHNCNKREEKTPSPIKSPARKKYFWVKSRYMDFYYNSHGIDPTKSVFKGRNK